MSETAEKFDQWAVVEDFEGLYEVSARGEVRRVGPAAVAGNGRGGGARVGRVLKPQRRSSGYLSVQLWRDGRVHNRLVHCLVAAAFIGPRPPNHDVNHRDGNKRNNAASNLEYLTRSENNSHAYRTGLRSGFAGRPAWA